MSDQDLLNNQKADVEIFNANLDRPAQVYIPNQSGHDFSPAERYGSLLYVTKGTVRPFEINKMARCWISMLYKSIRYDYILVSSLTILTVIGAAMFGFLHGRINLLLYRNGKYIQRTIIFQNLLDAEQDKEKEN